MKQEIINKIKEYDTIILHRHVMADGDAYGSQLGLKKAIKLNYPNKKVYAVGKDYEHLSSLGKMDVISDEVYANALVIVTDCANIERIDDQRYSTGKFLIKIDHHLNRTPYGDLEWVDPNYPAACEMIADLLEFSKWKMNADIGKTVFYGIVTDTLRFEVERTDYRTFDLAAFLIRTGFNLSSLYEELYAHTLDDLKAKAELVNMAQVQNGVGWIIINDDFLKKYNIPYDENGKFANTLKDVIGIDIWVTFVRNEDHSWRVEFRSKQAPVNEVATKWGGGGHKLASGAKISNIDDALNIVSDLQNVLKESKK